MRRMHAAVVLFFCFFSTAFAYDWSTNPGDGSAGNPYQISTAEQLNSIGADTSLWGKCYILTNDIDMSAYTGTQYNIIGTDSNYPFAGTFDGNGHKIRNLTYTTTVFRTHAGLFGYAMNATIRNTGIENLSLSTKSYNTGGLVGYLTGGTITNCSSAGMVTSSAYNSYSGGLVGYQNSGTINNCNTTGSVISPTITFPSQSYAGGLVGYQYSGTIMNSNSMASITASAFDWVHAGGLVGYQYNGTITHCYAMSSVNVPFCRYVACAGVLVGTQMSGLISNCYSSNGSVSALCYPIAGGLVGNQGENGIIIDCYSSCLVNASSKGGGLVGESDGSITNCYSTGSVAASFSAGGLVGFQESGIIAGCYSTDSAIISTTSIGARIGGLVGWQLKGSITNCYSTKSVHAVCTSENGYIYAGGLIGNQWRSGSIAKCYSTGSITTSGPGVKHVGGLVGDGSGAMNSFWDIETSSLNASSGGKGRTSVQMKQAANYLAWNIPGQINWTINEGVDYPRLIWENQSGVSLPEQTLGDFIPGLGTLEDPYRISTPQQFNTIGIFPEEWNRSFILENDIDLAGCEFNIIGNNDTSFRGVFDGNAYAISNLTLANGESPYGVGLFGCTQDAVIKNLGVENFNISTIGAYIGGLTGSQEGGAIINCHTAGTINISFCDSYSVGGLVGFGFGNIVNCYSTGLIDISNAWAVCAGGLAGIGSSIDVVDKCYSTMIITISSSEEADIGGLLGRGGNIANSYSMGSILAFSSARTYAGGLVGGNYENSINNCYSSGSIRAFSSDLVCAGGLAGYQEGSLAKIENCYSAGLVEANEPNYLGGFIGNWDLQGSINACFWDTQTSGRATSAAGEGKATDELKMLSTFISTGWDFLGEDTNGIYDIWRMCVDVADYPRLGWESVDGDFACPDGVSVEDLEYFVGRWLSGDCMSDNNYCGGVDVDESGAVDLMDYAVFAGHWLEGVEL